MAKKKSSLKWSAGEKLKIIIATDALAEQDLGVYLRTNGVHAAQLRDWRNDVVKSLALAKTEIVQDSNSQLRQSLFSATGTCHSPDARIFSSTYKRPMPQVRWQQYLFRTLVFKYYG